MLPAQRNKVDVSVSMYAEDEVEEREVSRGRTDLKSCPDVSLLGLPSPGCVRDCNFAELGSSYSYFEPSLLLAVNDGF